MPFIGRTIMDKNPFPEEVKTVKDLNEFAKIVGDLE